jgi:hypothetical protein
MAELMRVVHDVMSFPDRAGICFDNASFIDTFDTALCERG